MKIFTFLLVFISSLGCSQNQIIAPSDSNITYIGRVETLKNSVHFSHAGVQIKFGFKGSELKVGLEDISDGTPEHNNFYNVFVNGEKLDSLAIQPGKKWYKIDYEFNNEICTVELFKRTEAMVAGAYFLGLKVNEGGTISKVNLKKKKIEWIGDSFTAGYGNLISIPPPPAGNPSTGFHAINQDNSLAWGCLASKALNAEYMSTVYSGRGVYRNWDNSEEGTVPSFYNYVSPNPEEGKKEWDFNQFQSDLIVITLGINDFGPETHETVVMADSSRFCSAYLVLLKIVHQKNPNAKILVTIGGGLSDYYPANFNRLSRSRLWIKAAVNSFNASNSTAIKTFELKTISPPYGEDWHPSLRAHQIMSEQAVSFIKEYMGW